MAQSDGDLLELGDQFDAISRQLDLAIEHGLDVTWETLGKFDGIATQIITTPATTMEGLCVKARVTCWGRLGDLDDSEHCPADERIALSMTRDLIRLYHPHLERPGALTKLVEDIERDAGRA